MVGLLDLAPATVMVPFGDGDAIEVRGVPVIGIAHLLQRFPLLQDLMTGGSAGDIGNLLQAAPEAVHAVIAMGCGFEPGHTQAESKAASLPAHLQAEMLSAIVNLTMPAGFGPFVERLIGLLGAPDGFALAKAQAMNSQEQSNE